MNLSEIRFCITYRASRRNFSSIINILNSSRFVSCKDSHQISRRRDLIGVGFLRKLDLSPRLLFQFILQIRMMIISEILQGLVQTGIHDNRVIRSDTSLIHRIYPGRYRLITCYNSSIEDFRLRVWK